MTGPTHDEAPRVVVRDKRRIDPDTGELREGADAPAPAPPSGTPSGAGADPVRELAERTDDLQRVTAEYANYRRRVERDRSASAELATGAVLSALLPVLDNIDRAREHGDVSGAFAAVAELLESTLGKVGLTAFGEQGDHFDPTRHEAVLHSTSPDVDRATCVQVMRRGYALGERLLRPAMVAVADPEPARETAIDEPAARDPSAASLVDGGD
ncbi:MAG: nucleotide exchange factor GrpE [Actinomycetota bacterium]|nr:nucleotide exchange factor GrpE [Actinomycetota bacterium]